MERLYWESFTFAPGVNTHHAWTEAGDQYARDIENLRVDENAYLRPRQSVGSRPEAMPERAVSGVAETGSHYFFVIDGGILYAVSRADGTRVRVDGVDGLSGRLYVVDEFRDFFVGMSEGDQQGFWIDTTEDVFQARNLGLDPPTLPALAAGNAQTQGLEFGVYVYALTAVRAFFTNLDRVDLPPQAANKRFGGGMLFNGMESNPSYFVVKVDGADADVYADDELITHVLTLPAGNGGVAVAGVTYDDPQQTGIYVYRTDAIASGGGRVLREDVEGMEFRVTDFLNASRPSDGGRDDSGTLHFGVDLSDRPLMRVDNHRLPPDAKQIVYFNDLVFAAAGDELRYSDVRDGALVQWAFPEANSIRAEGDIVFCAELRGVLLFGGPHGLWRLTGVDEYSFQRDQVSGVGPVSGSAWVRLDEGIGFIAPGGIYITDGVSVQKVSTVLLDGYFEGNSAVDGSAVLLENLDVLYCVRFGNGARFQFLQSKRGGFFKWLGVPAVQWADLDDAVVFVDGRQAAVQTLEAVGTVDEEAGWFWLSHEIDFKEQGFGEALKSFRWLELSSGHSGEGLVQIIVDGVSEAVFHEVEFRGDAQRPVRVPIGRRGERIQFRVSGIGDCNIRYLRLMAEVRSARSRF